MQNSDSKQSRTRQYPWTWASLARLAHAETETEQKLSIEELMALTSDQSVRAQHDYRINATRAPRR